MKKLIAVQKEETVVEGQKAFRMEADIGDGQRALVMVITNGDVTPSRLTVLRNRMRSQLPESVKVFFYGKDADDDIDLYVEEM